MQYRESPDVYEWDEFSRFALGKKGKRTLIVFGVNPSTADNLSSDKTISRVIKLAAQNQCDGWLMLNIYAQRSTDPSELHPVCKPELHAKNLQYIYEYIKQLSDNILCAAWGVSIKEKEYLVDCLKDIHGTIGGSWKSIGPTTKNGHPKHPARLANNLILQDFDIEQYLRV